MSVFHTGEQELQQRVGAAERLATLSNKVILSALPEQHQQFYPLLPLVFIAAQDRNQQLWASVLCGTPDFVQATDSKHLHINTLPTVTDPLFEHLQVSSPIGLLGLEFPTRRRNRANGQISALDKQGFSLQVEQCFGNCPKYIQTRTPTIVERPDNTTRIISDRLDTQQAQLIQQADTFFIASGWQGALDISHRGGKPQFINLEDEKTLYVPDFAGNNYFNTFGNLLQNPRAGLLFIDFNNGDLLHLAVTAELIWQDQQRGMRLAIHELRYRPQALPILWGEASYSPYLG